jgi:tRNA dimethylallyltransferase
MIKEISKYRSPPIIVITGPTASGKTALAVKVAIKIGGEIISADSRAIYKELNIGTAKPTKIEQSSVPHFGIDIINPGDRFSVYDFQKYTKSKIKELHKRGKIPIICGGTGLYINSIIYNYKFKDNFKRSTDKKFRKNTLVLALQIDRSKLKKRIEDRVDVMIKNGLLNEFHSIRHLEERQIKILGPEYKYLSLLFNKEITESDWKKLVVTGDLQLAKRQMTWLRNKINPNHINWINIDDKNMEAKALSKIKQFLL